MKIILRTGAETDISEAYHWYEERVTGLGAEFFLALDSTLDSIQENPDRFPILYQGVRRALLQRFPYGVFFIHSREIISVLAVMHTARNPAKWRKS